MIYLCKASVKETPKTQLEIQKEEEERQRRLEASKWTCPYCKEVTDRFYERFHYRCIPNNLRNKRENGESDTEVCTDCFEFINSYYKNFHYANCRAHQVKVSYPSQSKAKANQAHFQTIKDPLEEFRDTPAFKGAQLFLYDLRKKQEENYGINKCKI